FSRARRRWRTGGYVSRRVRGRAVQQGSQEPKAGLQLEGAGTAGGWRLQSWRGAESVMDGVQSAVVLGGERTRWARHTGTQAFHLASGDENDWLAAGSDRGGLRWQHVSRGVQGARQLVDSERQSTGSPLRTRRGLWADEANKADTACTARTRGQHVLLYLYNGQSTSAHTEQHEQQGRRQARLKQCVVAGIRQLPSNIQASVLHVLGRRWHGGRVLFHLANLPSPQRRDESILYCVSRSTRAGEHYGCATLGIPPCVGVVGSACHSLSKVACCDGTAAARVVPTFMAISPVSADCGNPSGGVKLSETGLKRLFVTAMRHPRLRIAA
ncbi:hypothetical protein BDV95DRAFT_645396, partial [Massariosphaeria phaeospora]